MLEVLFEGLSQSLEKNCFSRILHSVIDILAAQGVSIDRMQVPMSRYSGLRHPLAWSHHIDLQRRERFIQNEFRTLFFPSERREV